MDNRIGLRRQQSIKFSNLQFVSIVSMFENMIDAVAAAVTVTPNQTLFVFLCFLPSISMRITWIFLVFQASFVLIVFSEYQLIECAFLFQTNLSKQWIENIRAAKINFQLLLEESKMKLQNAHNYSPSSTTATNTTSSTSTSANNTGNIVHQSLPSLSSTSETSLDTTNVKQSRISIETSSIDESINSFKIETNRRSSKNENEPIKLIDQPRRNSRTDHKNFGRFHTADGTGTHTTNGSSSSSSSSSINPSLIKSNPSAPIIKRMSWNNEPMNKNDSPTIPNNELSNTNSFRSVHSSSGVSSTGSFIFSADEELSSITTATTSSSNPSALITSKQSLNNDITDELDEFDGKSSSSTVIGTDDREQHYPIQNISNTSTTTNSTEIINSEPHETTSQPGTPGSRLSSTSSTTLTSHHSTGTGKH